MKKELLCLVIAGSMLTACGGSTSAVSSAANAAVEQASEAGTGVAETEAAPSTDIIYLKETVTDYDKDGNLIETTTYSYNDHNDVSEYVITFPDDDPARYYYEYDYRDDGTIASSRRYDSRDLMREETFYEEDGETIDHIVRNTYSDEHEEEKDSSEEDVYWIKIQTILNADKAQLSKTTFLEDGSVRRKDEQEYNEYGDIIHVVNSSYKDGESSITNENTFEYEYNTDGTIAKTSAVLKASKAPDSVYTIESTYQDGYLYKDYVSGVTNDSSWWQETIYDENGFPVSWSSDNMEEDEQKYYEGEDLAGLVTYRSDGTVDIQPEDGFIATYDGDVIFVRLGSRQDINGDPDEELDENGNVAVRTYYSYTGDINKRVEYTYIIAEN